MAKVSATELRTELANAAMDLLGRSGGLSGESGARAPFGGRAEWTFRLSPIFRFGGGTNEVQRDIVAGAGLGLRAYLERQVPFDRIRALEREGRSDAALWQEMAAHGWLGLAFAERCGGGGGSLVDAGVLAFELARRAAI